MAQPSEQGAPTLGFEAKCRIISLVSLNHPNLLKEETL